MFIYGDHDRSTPEERRRNADELPKARLITLQQTSHFAALERPRQIANTIVGASEHAAVATA